MGLIAQISVQATTPAPNVNSGSRSISRDVASGAEMVQGSYAITSSFAALNMGGVETIRSALIQNMSTTPGEIVTVALDNLGAQVVSVLQPGTDDQNPGDFCYLNNPPDTLYVKSATGTPQIFRQLIEEDP